MISCSSTFPGWEVMLENPLVPIILLLAPLEDRSDIFFLPLLRKPLTVAMAFIVVSWCHLPPPSVFMGEWTCACSALSKCSLCWSSHIKSSSAFFFYLRNKITDSGTVQLCMNSDTEICFACILITPIAIVCIFSPFWQRFSACRLTWLTDNLYLHIHI